ncbi:MAG: FtsX-like permease family protein, partial [Pygmaiobacter sp.]
DRHSNLSFESYASNADKIEAIARVFPIFFFLVAALVALTTMTRMVEEERPQIGTLKALGYSNGKIVAKYLLYAGFAGLLGSVCGLLVGMRLFPTVIINAYNIMYEIPKALTPFNCLAGLSSAAAMIGCALLATLSACSAELHEVPARLMLPKAPKAGKRVFLEYITPLWSRMKFTHKVTARNLIRYKKRFFMTVIGIAGCTALLVTGFGIRDSVSDIVSKQFDDLYHYNLIVGLKNKDALNGRDLNALRQNSSLVEDSISVLQEDDKIVPKNGKPQDSIYLLAPSDTAHYKDFFDFRHRTNDTPVVFDDNAVIISEKLAERQSLAVGDTITVINKDQKEASFVITDICENYVQHYVFLSQKAYANAFGTPAQDNMLLVRAP